MASFYIHLAIAKRYSEKNKINNLNDFYKGNIDPDLVVDKSISHYDLKKDKSNLIDHLENRVILPDFLKENNVDTDYDKGVFLHLVTDYLFFTNFFDREYLSKNNYDKFFGNLYYSYDCVNEYILDKYKLDLSLFKDVFANNQKNNDTYENKENIFNINKLDQFIEKTSNIDLEAYKDKLIENNINILP